MFRGTEFSRNMLWQHGSRYNWPLHYCDRRIDAFFSQFLFCRSHDDVGRSAGPGAETIGVQGVPAHYARRRGWMGLPDLRRRGAPPLHRARHARDGGGCRRRQAGGRDSEHPWRAWRGAGPQVGTRRDQQWQGRFSHHLRPEDAGADRHGEDRRQARLPSCSIHSAAWC